MLPDENAVLDANGEVATEAGEMVKNVSPTEIVVLNVCGGTGRSCFENAKLCLLKSG